MLEELLKMYDEQRANFSSSEEIPIVVWQIDALVERIRELEAENANLRNEIRALQERC